MSVPEMKKAAMPFADKTLPRVEDALSSSRNYAVASYFLTITGREHINGLCDLLEQTEWKRKNPGPLFDASRLPPPDELGWFQHPDFEAILGDNETSQDDVETRLLALGWEPGYVHGDERIDEDSGDYDAIGWTPTPPKGDGWRQISAFDTEDGPYALFVRPAGLIPPGKALVPIRMTRAMKRVVEQEDWEWADVLAAAQSITEDEHSDALRAEHEEICFTCESCGGPIRVGEAHNVDSHGVRWHEQCPRGRSFQSRVQLWMRTCFGEEIAADRLERGDRLLEETFELLQSGDYPRERVRALEHYVWSRPAGEPRQEAGGVMVTLAAYCLAHDIDMYDAGEIELARVWTKIEKIRAKQAAKPTGSALPIAQSPADTCPDCGRKKATDLKSMLAGGCPKWGDKAKPAAFFDCKQAAAARSQQ